MEPQTFLPPKRQKKVLSSMLHAWYVRWLVFRCFSNLQCPVGRSSRFSQLLLLSSPCGLSEGFSNIEHCLTRCRHSFPVISVLSLWAGHCCHSLNCCAQCRRWCKLIKAPFLASLWACHFITLCLGNHSRIPVQWASSSRDFLFSYLSAVLEKISPTSKIFGRPDCHF